MYSVVYHIRMCRLHQNGSYVWLVKLGAEHDLLDNQPCGKLAPHRRAKSCATSGMEHKVKAD